jgi:hypothetical protein
MTRNRSRNCKDKMWEPEPPSNFPVPQPWLQHLFLLWWVPLHLVTRVQDQEHIHDYVHKHVHEHEHVHVDVHKT